MTIELLLVLVVVTFVTGSFASESARIISSSGRIDYEQIKIAVNFSRTVGNVSTYFGTQVDGTAIPESDYQDKLKALGPIYFRSGIMSEYVTYPPNSSVNDWFWQRLRTTMSFISSIGAKALFMMNGAPANLCENGQFGNPPRKDCYDKIAEWYAYFLLQVKNLGYDVQQYFWEVWNEPNYQQFGGVENYVAFYNLVENRMRLVDPGVKLGTALSYFNNNWRDYIVQNVNSIQFLGWHQYGGYENDDNDTLMMNTKNLYEDVPSLAEQYKKANPKVANAVSIISEFNANPNDGIEAKDYVWGRQTTDNSTDDRLRDQFNCAWYASALSHMIRSRVYVASFFGSYNFKYGMFYKNDNDEIVEFPVYSTAKLFSKYIAFGSDIVDSSTSDSMIDVLAVRNPSRIIVLINKHGYDVNIELGATECTRFLDLKSNMYVDASNIALARYEVIFLRAE
jgi:hypothetical protein